MPALPYQDGLLVPIQWTLTPIKTTMQTGSLTMSGTIGNRPWTETATLTWVLSKADGLALMNELKSGMFNRVYDYTCIVKGPIKIRPTDSFSYGESFGMLPITVTLNVECLS